MLLGKLDGRHRGRFPVLSRRRLWRRRRPREYAPHAAQGRHRHHQSPPDLAPNHVARLKELTRKGFYDGVVFHRVIDGFMAQTGDPTGTGTGGSDLPDLKAEFTDAFRPRHHRHGARFRSRQRQLAILHHVRRRELAERPVHGVRRGGERDGIRRHDQEGRQANNGMVDGPDKIISMKVAADAQ